MTQNSIKRMTMVIIGLLFVATFVFTWQHAAAANGDFAAAEMGLVCALHGNITSSSQLATVGYQYDVDQIVLAGLLELPFLLIAVYFAFRTANALKGGVFGRGMLLMALGATVMAVGHLHLLVIQMWNINIFGSIFGTTLGTVVWIVALIATWGLTGAGFYSIYKSSSAA